MSKKKNREVAINQLAATLSVYRCSLGEVKRELASMKTAFYEERKKTESAQASEDHVREVISEVRDELAEERRKNRDIWSSVHDILIDSKVLSYIKGWYWHIEDQRPVYVDGISKDGLTGFSVAMIGGQFNGSVTDTFRFEDLIRIDTNLEMQY